MVPHWAIVAGWVFLGIGFASALAILVDVVALGNRQQMWIMNIVHPITALYLGPIWVWAYFRHGRRSSQKQMHRERDRRLRESGDADDADELRRAGASTDGEELRPWHVANATSHCGAGCTLGDIAGEWIVFASGWTIAGATLWPELALDFVLAWTIGIVFQYFTIVPMRDDVSPSRGLWLAIRADTLSILAFQVGLFGWMILSARVLWTPPLPIDSSAHWWMMQVGMVVGFVTAYPVNRLLVKRGWKEKMDYRTHLAEMLDEERGVGRKGGTSTRERTPVHG
jgi:hypothetical protein